MIHITSIYIRLKIRIALTIGSYPYDIAGKIP